MHITSALAFVLLHWPAVFGGRAREPYVNATPIQQPATYIDSLRMMDREGREAREAGQWDAALRHATRMDGLLGGYPSTKLAMARASLRLGDTTAAARALNAVLGMGLFVDIGADSTLAGALRRTPSFATQFAEQKAKIGKFATVATMREKDFVAEGIAYDSTRHRTFVSSILFGTVVEVASNGTIREFADLKRDGGWSGLGLAVDAKRNRLWVTTAWYPHGGRFARGDSGMSAVHLYDLQRGTLLRRYSILRGAHEPGDLCVAPNGDVFVSDGRAGTISVIREGSDSLATFVPPGSFFSPQGCAVDERSSQLFVADYVIGIMSVNLKSGLVHRLTKPQSAATAQIDGLVMKGDVLFGVQNGTVPNRVLAMSLNREHSALASVRVVVRDTAVVTDATHLAVAGRDLLFVENSGFNRYDAAGKLRNGAVELPSRIGRVSIPH